MSERTFQVSLEEDMLWIRDNFGHVYCSDLNESQLANLQVFMELGDECTRTTRENRG
jgi:hypothetical protein